MTFEAKQLLKQTQSLPLTMNMLKNQSNIAIQKQQWMEAINKLSALAVFIPTGTIEMQNILNKQINAYKNMADEFYEKTEYHKAEICYQVVLKTEEITQGHAKIYLKLAKIQCKYVKDKIGINKIEHFEKGVFYCKKSLKIEPNNVECISYYKKMTKQLDKYWKIKIILGKCKQ